MGIEKVSRFCLIVKAIGQRGISTVTASSVPVRVPSQRPFALMVTSVNDKVGYEVKLGAVHISGIYLITQKRFS